MTVMSNKIFSAIRIAISALEEEGPHKSSHDTDEDRMRREAHNAALGQVLKCLSSIEAQHPIPGAPFMDRDVAERQTSKGVMMRISKFEEILRGIRESFGNTCVYVRDATWGAAALNAFDDDSKEDAESQSEKPLHRDVDDAGKILKIDGKEYKLVEDRWDNTITNGIVTDVCHTRIVMEYKPLKQPTEKISGGSATYDRDGQLTRLTAIVGGQTVQLVREDAISARWWSCIAERKRQVEVEGFDAKHDAQYTDCQLSFAAASYAVASAYDGTPYRGVVADAPSSWPFATAWWKPGDARNSIKKAIALLMAEWERLDNLPGAPT